MRTKRKVAVVLFCMKRNKIKIPLFRKTPERGGYWQPITGKPKPGESNFLAALRELDEESKLRYLIIGGLIGPIHHFTFKYRGKRWNVEVYAAELPAKLEPTLCQEHDQYAWVTLRKARSLITHPDNWGGIAELCRYLGISCDSA